MGTRQQLSTLTTTDATVLPSALLGGCWYGATGTTAQSIATSPANPVPVQFPTEEFNNGITVSGTGKRTFTVPAGVWLISATVRFSAHAGGGERYLQVAPSSSTATRYGHASATPGATAADRSLTATAIVRTTGTAGISAYVWHDAGATLTLMRVAYSGHRMQIAYLGKP